MEVKVQISGMQNMEQESCLQRYALFYDLTSMAYALVPENSNVNPASIAL
jgi:hypothetical protein